MHAASPAKLTRFEQPASTSTSPEVNAKLTRLQPLPVEGPDSALIEKYNIFLQAWRDYYVSAQTNLDADIGIADRLAWSVVRSPACTPAGALLKIRSAASHMAGGDALNAEFPYIEEDFTINPQFAGQIEYTLITSLRDDLRASLMSTHTTDTTSPEVAELLAIWKRRWEADDAAGKAVAAAKEESVGALAESELIYAAQLTGSALDAIEGAIAYQPAASFADIMAKYETVREYAELEDHDARMKTESGVERMLWSICGDLERFWGMRAARS